MKIKLEYPYNTRWKYGYLATNKEGRPTLTLYNNSKDRSATQYARYLLSVKLGRFLTKNETVDHIDGDKTNNALSNLQILSSADNTRKSHKKEDYVLICPVCKKAFVRKRTQVSGKQKKIKIKNGELCCSRHCGGIFGHKHGPIV